MQRFEVESDLIYQLDQKNTAFEIIIKNKSFKNIRIRIAD